MRSLPFARATTINNLAATELLATATEHHVRWPYRRFRTITTNFQRLLHYRHTQKNKKKKTAGNTIQHIAR
jgi:hypothetical protein